MKIFGAFLFSLIVFTVCSVARSERISGYNPERSQKKFWEKESESNSVRKADISSLDYIILTLSKLDIAAAISIGLSDIIDDLKSLTEKKIINLSAYSNTELKLMYGPANLEALSEYDNNYTIVIRHLNKLGTKLYESGNITAATSYLEYAIEIGSDISSTYSTLCQIYIDTSNEAKIDSLIESAEKITSLSKPIILDKINNIKTANK